MIARIVHDSSCLDITSIVTKSRSGYKPVLSAQNSRKRLLLHFGILRAPRPYYARLVTQ
jgi:hypothetical protein